MVGWGESLPSLMAWKGAIPDGKPLVFQERPLIEISMGGGSGQNHPQNHSQLLSALLSEHRTVRRFLGFSGHGVFLLNLDPQRHKQIESILHLPRKRDSGLKTKCVVS